MNVKAQLRYLRIAPRKVRLVTNLIKGKTVQKAEAQLAFLAKHSARPILKLLQSAASNAENNFKLKKDNLYVKNITVDEGPRLKRWRPRAFGRAAPIIKRSSHILIILDEIKAVKAGKTKPLKAGKVPFKNESDKATIAKQPVVDWQEIKHEASGKNEKSNAPDQQKKKSPFGFKSLKKAFTRRLGER